MNHYEANGGGGKKGGGKRKNVPNGSARLATHRRDRDPLTAASGRPTMTIFLIPHSGLDPFTRCRAPYSAKMISSSAIAKDRHDYFPVDFHLMEYR